MNKKVWIVFALLVIHSMQAIGDESAKNQKEPIEGGSWEIAITRPQDYKGKDIMFDGWLSVQVNAGLPTIALFATKEAFEFRRPRKVMTVDRDSFHKMMKDSGVLSTLDYSVLHGRYVEIVGRFEMPTEGQKTYYIGSLIKLKDLYLDGNADAVGLGKKAFHAKDER